MTIKELKSGVKFSYGSTGYYNIEDTGQGQWIVCQFGRFVANIYNMDEEVIQAYTFVMNDRVDLKIDIDKCILMEEPSGAVIL